MTNQGYQIYLHRFWFAISLAVSSPENHFIPKFWNYYIAIFEVIYRRSNAIARILYTKLEQIISLRRKVDCDWNASAELDCIPAQELKRNFAHIVVEQEKVFVARYGFTVYKWKDIKTGDLW